jgi:hypothetical protein
MSEASKLLVGALEAGTELTRENKELRAAGDELAAAMAALIDEADWEPRGTGNLEGFWDDMKATLPQVQAALRHWREVTK